MDFKIGDKFNVIVPGFSPTIARVDNISERKGETFYHISFQEEHLYTICRVVSARAFEEMIEKYDQNKDHLDDFMMSKDESTIGNKPEETAPKKKGSTLDEIGSGASVSSINMDLESNAEDKFSVTGATTSSIKAEVNVGLTSQKE